MVENNPLSMDAYDFLRIRYLAMHWSIKDRAMHDP